MENTFFFDAVTVDGSPDRVYTASDVAKSRAAYLTTGVLTPDSLKVSALSGHAVAVSLGKAVIEGYIYTNSAQKNVQIGASAAVYPRIDLVVLRLDLTARSITVKVIAGTPSADPVAPSVTADGDKKDLPLAEVYVEAGTSVIVPSDVTDRRVFSKFLPTENAVAEKIAQALADLDILDADELDTVREVMDAVELDGDEDSVLCGDGAYRKFPRLVRTELARFTVPGTYRFTASSYPSESGFYDIELAGGGGAGGASVGAYTRGGGGGAGAYVAVSGVRIANGSGITVGAGGVGASFADGTDGGDSSVAGIVAKGGHGGKASEGGEGGVSGFFTGASGTSGCTDIRTVAPPSVGCGGSTVFGTGATNSGMEASAKGAAAVNAGCGGAGGGGIEAAASVAKGGNGAPGIVILYGYEEETEGVAI